jgi:cellulase
MRVLGKDGGEHSADISQWYHQYGPILVYLARWPISTYTNFHRSSISSPQNIWFKIVQFGLTPNAPSLHGPWLHSTYLTGSNATGFPVTIPKTLKPGAYLIRHEVINLQSARNYGSLFYVECAQLVVEGGGGGVDG